MQQSTAQDAVEFCDHAPEAVMARERPAPSAIAAVECPVDAHRPQAHEQSHTDEHWPERFPNNRWGEGMPKGPSPAIG